MKELKLILEILEDREADMVQELSVCEASHLYQAAMYAKGNIAAYKHAADLLRAYINATLPWVED